MLKNGPRNFPLAFSNHIINFTEGYFLMDNYRLGIFMVLEPIFYGACCRYTGSCCSMLRRWKFWRAVFMVSRFRLSLVIGNRQAKHLYAGNQGDFQYEKTACCMVLVAIMISFNWGIFIWAVEAGRIVETSMGYYISPLMNVLFGVVFLRERLAKLQIAAVSCAAVGIGVIIVHNGGLPWVALTLPLTFAFYGLLKKLLLPNR